MKKALLLFLFILAGRFVAPAQDCNTSFLGTKTLYKNSTRKYTPPPAGYNPVFINHVGRHGARHLTKDVSASAAYAILQKADSANALSAQGKKLMRMVVALQKIEKGNTKSISKEGKDELEGLGSRMFMNYRNVFAGKCNLDVAVTKEVRTKQSADAFLQGLNSRLADKSSVNFYTDDTDLRFYDLSPTYKNFEDGVDDGGLMLSLGRTLRVSEINKAIAGRFFTVDFLRTLDKAEQDKFVSDVFGFATIVYSLKAEIKKAGFTPEEVNFKSFFTCNELTTLAQLDNADGYLKKGPGINNNGIQVRVAVPLLVNFIKTADEFINKGRVTAQLRFAHAETIAPFAALLEISSANKASTNLAKLDGVWRSSNIIPLSSNIQWVFYKKKGSPGYLVKVLLNEKEARITGLAAKNFPCYKWDDLRRFYISKLKKFNVRITDDMDKYLAGIQ